MGNAFIKNGSKLVRGIVVFFSDLVSEPEYGKKVADAEFEAHNDVRQAFSDGELDRLQNSGAILASQWQAGPVVLGDIAATICGAAQLSHAGRSRMNSCRNEDEKFDIAEHVSHEHRRGQFPNVTSSTQREVPIPTRMRI